MSEWIRRCPECGRFDDYRMEDGSWICHSCGHVEFTESLPPLTNRDPGDETEAK